jgi:hypothetical protein
VAKAGLTLPGGCVGVALETDGRNARSQAAIERLGAVREGVLRKHMNVRGYRRDPVYYSLLDTGWPGVRAPSRRVWPPAPRLGHRPRPKDPGSV